MSKQALYTQTEEIAKLITALPETPGIYKYFDENLTIIYVGKAKNLKKRIASYFHKQHDNARIRLLVKRIYSVETIHVDTEFDALLLENTLIKKHQPRYNIRLKDDKTFPWICFSNEPYPRMFVSRNPDFQKASCFGPYPSHKMMHTVIELVKKTFPLRTCKLNLNASNIEKNKFKICLEFQIGNCKGPCEGLQSQKDYLKSVEHSKDIVKGNLKGIIKLFKGEMNKNSKFLNFEKAQKYKEKIILLEQYQSRSPLVHPSLKNCDVVSIISDNNQNYYANYMRVISGAVVRSHSFELLSKMSESIQEVFDHALLQTKDFLNEFSNQLVVPFLPSTRFPNTEFVIPKAGHKKELLVLSEKNARLYMHERKSKSMSLSEARKLNTVIEKARKALNMQKSPIHIEAFDNSNIQGEFPVAAMVVFKNGKPATSLYRHFSIKTVDGPNDFASMEEVVYRRYKRLLDEGADIPQLIVIDGGKGQLQSAANSLAKLNLLNEVKLISIAKKLETIFVYGDAVPLYFDKTSPVLRLLQHIRNEAHRFGIKHHRTKRNSGLLKTQLTDIKGIGNKTAHTLLEHFGSVKTIENANFDQIAQVIGKTKASIIINALKNK